MNAAFTPPASTLPLPKSTGRTSRALWMADPRNYQIAVLSTFLIVGKLSLGFGYRMDIGAIIIGSALLTQALLFDRASLKSALISSLSLMLLLRTHSLALAALAGFIAIVGKRILRTPKGGHLFNPSAFSLVVMSLSFDGAWLTPGQWGAMGLSALALAGAGLVVVSRAKRLDTAVSFFVAYAAIILSRALWLGDPLSIPLHGLQNGALIVFAFFMITDPKTTPNTRSTRVAFGILVAVVACVLQFQYYLSSAPIYALVLVAPTLVFLNRKKVDEALFNTSPKIVSEQKVFA